MIMITSLFFYVLSMLLEPSARMSSSSSEGDSTNHSGNFFESSTLHFSALKS